MTPLDLATLGDPYGRGSDSLFRFSNNAASSIIALLSRSLLEIVNSALHQTRHAVQVCCSCSWSSGPIRLLLSHDLLLTDAA